MLPQGENKPFMPMFTWGNEQHSNSYFFFLRENAPLLVVLCMEFGKETKLGLGPVPAIPAPPQRQHRLIKPREALSSWLLCRQSSEPHVSPRVGGGAEVSQQSSGAEGWPGSSLNQEPERATEIPRLSQEPVPVPVNTFGSKI